MGKTTILGHDLTEVCKQRAYDRKLADERVAAQNKEISTLKHELRQAKATNANLRNKIDRSAAGVRKEDIYYNIICRALEAEKAEDMRKILLTVTGVD